MEGLFVLTGYGTSRADLLIGVRDGKDTRSGGREVNMRYADSSQKEHLISKSPSHEYRVLRSGLCASGETFS